MRGKMETSDILKKAAEPSQGEIIVETPSWINTHANCGRWVSDCDCISSPNRHLVVLHPLSKMKEMMFSRNRHLAKHILHLHQTPFHTKSKCISSSNKAFNNNLLPAPKIPLRSQSLWSSQGHYKKYPKVEIHSKNQGQYQWGLYSKGGFHPPLLLGSPREKMKIQGWLQSLCMSYGTSIPSGPKTRTDKLAALNKSGSTLAWKPIVSFFH